MLFLTTPLRAPPISIAIRFVIASLSLADRSPAEAALLERLRGYSIDAQSTMRMEGKDRGKIFRDLNTSFMLIYISSSGRIFDYSIVEDVGARTRQFIGGNSGMKVVRFGEQ
jgi:hypothetical protein